ncbi:DDE-type integrase/transposase/recombinase [Dendrosporobacter sp. 1207_IL3150]|uniref:DDE-type integrase/transposase/recombinase n=1 Tax=Dendrosporobacter sp. 1207_IL3150 TaxID=3084054 RepID=UPI003FA5C94C
MSDRMSKEQVISALINACKRYGKSPGGILHSDRGSQYCSKDIRNRSKSMG